MRPFRLGDFIDKRKRRRRENLGNSRGSLAPFPFLDQWIYDKSKRTRELSTCVCVHVWISIFVNMYDKGRSTYQKKIVHIILSNSKYMLKTSQFLFPTITMIARLLYGR